MEKKGSRSVQPLSKGLGTDSKKNQDVANKPWPRSSRRREPNGGTFPKNETSRKCNPQRNKTIDKRPRPRGYYYSGASGGMEETRLEVQEAELGSVFVQGSKKQSLNHLLNFHFEPRDGHWHSGLVHSKSGNRWNSTVKHKYNKEQFLQANCQFIVQNSGDYKLYLNNTDALVNWDLIEQVNIHVLEFPSCPICLYPPIAAKMTRCGHIYCWSCVLHYLALSDKTWRKCPICYEALHKKDLKSVVAIPHTTFKTNEDITFKLMKRARGSLTAYPVDQQIPDNDFIYNVSDKNAINVYSKLLLANSCEVLAIIEREKKELQRQLLEDENCPEKCFIEQALTLLAEREKSVITEHQCTPIEEIHVVEHQEDTIANEANLMWFNNGDDNLDFSQNTLNQVSAQMDASLNVRERQESVNSDESTEDPNASMDNPITVEDLEILPSVNAGQQSSKYYYFYQASDGQHIYLHALNVRMLEHTYGSLEFCPKTITGCIIEKESGSMTEELRKRLRYLQHLPVTCQFEVAEIQLKLPIVTKETLEHFREQIGARCKHRQRRARDEKRREKRIAEEENKRMGKYAAANIHLESHYQFPKFQTESLKNAPPLGSPHSERSLSPTFSGTDNTSLSGSLNTEQQYSGPSFAKMLSSNITSTPVWPTRRSNTANHQTVIEANKQIKSTNNPKHSDSEPEVEGYVPVPAFNQSFGDAIALALEKAALNNDADGVAMSGKKKKKNKQKKILFATSMACSSN